VDIQRKSLGKSLNEKGMKFVKMVKIGFFEQGIPSSWSRVIFSNLEWDG
jgi:hypothetical protein